MEAGGLPMSPYGVIAHALKKVFFSLMVNQMSCRAFLGRDQASPTPFSR